MPRIINSTNITLDGVMQRLHEWHFDYVDEEALTIATADLMAAGSVLMGRGTYDVFADSWPQRDGEYADRINEMPKYVASRTLEQADWNNTAVVREVTDKVSDLRRHGDGDVIMYGFGPVARTLLDNGLLDEIRFFVHPVLAGGSGQWSDMLVGAGTTARLDLAEHRALQSGVVQLTFRPGATR